MLPTLLPDSLVIATGFYRRIAKGDLVIFAHQGIYKIKRIEKIRGSQFYALGDNAPGSSDSRAFGWLAITSIKAKVIWPQPK
jgi:hypothetical protein